MVRPKREWVPRYIGSWDRALGYLLDLDRGRPAQTMTVWDRQHLC
jgi:hypothetical protein